MPPHRLPALDHLGTRMAKAMSHPVRVRALAILQQREASPSEIARELGVPIINVSHHVQTLLKLELIEQVAVRHVRGAVEHRYRLIRQRQLGPEEIALMPRDGVRRHIHHAAEVMLEDVQGALRSDAFFARPDSHLTRTPLELDEQGFRELDELLCETLDRALAVEAAAQARLAGRGAGSERIATTLTMAHYEKGEAAASDEQPRRAAG